MKKVLLAILLIAGAAMHAQKIRFEYDAAGNQVLRTWCSNCQSRSADSHPDEESAALGDRELEKFFPEDVISYHPNPVREELFLKWELAGSNRVSSIDVFSPEGKVVRSFSDLENEDSKTLHFSEFAKGVYFVSLNYSDGEQKSIKIIKN